MKEIIIYSIAGIATLWISGYSIHMLIGGLVAPDTEQKIIIIACLLGIGAMGYMVYDVVRHRKKNGSSQKR